MKMLTGLMLTATMLLAVPAFADDKPSGAAPPAMQMPKPDPALDAYKGMIGTWTCKGTTKMGGMTMDAGGTAKFAWDLNNFWVTFSFTGNGKMAYKSMGIYGYDAGKKLYTAGTVDNMGGSSMMTSKGASGDKEEWTGTEMMMGNEVPVTETITHTSPKEVHLTSSSGTGDHASSMDAICKK